MIETKNIHEKELGNEISLLVRYLYHQGERRSKILEFINNFLSDLIVNFSLDQWIPYIDKYIGRVKKRPPLEIEYVPVTQKELDIIKQVKDKQKERLLFTLLVLAKFNNLKSSRERNNDWVNYDEKTIFKLARVACSMRNRDKMIYDLQKEGYIKNSKKITSLNLQVLFVDTESEAVLKINDMRELGYQYQETLPNTLIRRCISCGRPYKLRSAKSRAGLCPICTENGAKIINGQRIKRCEICGQEFACNPSSKRSYLCPVHQKIVTREKAAERKRKSRKNILCHVL